MEANRTLKRAGVLTMSRAARWALSAMVIAWNPGCIPDEKMPSPARTCSEGLQGATDSPTLVDCTHNPGDLACGAPTGLTAKAGSCGCESCADSGSQDAGTDDTGSSAEDTGTLDDTGTADWGNLDGGGGQLDGGEDGGDETAGDTSAESGSETASDSGADAAIETTIEAGDDDSSDASSDASTDVGTDTASDGSSDGALETSLDAPSDSAMDITADTVTDSIATDVMGDLAPDSRPVDGGGGGDVAPDLSVVEVGLGPVTGSGVTGVSDASPEVVPVPTLQFGAEWSALSNGRWAGGLKYEFSKQFLGIDFKSSSKIEFSLESETEIQYKMGRDGGLPYKDPDRHTIYPDTKFAARRTIKNKSTITASQEFQLAIVTTSGQLAEATQTVSYKNYGKSGTSADWIAARDILKTTDWDAGVDVTAEEVLAVIKKDLMSAASTEALRKLHNTNMEVAGFVFAEQPAPYGCRMAPKANEKGQGAVKACDFHWTRVMRKKKGTFGIWSTEAVLYVLIADKDVTDGKYYPSQCGALTGDPDYPRDIGYFVDGGHIRRWEIEMSTVKSAYDAKWTCGHSSFFVGKEAHVLRSWETTPPKPMYFYFESPQ